MHLDRGSIFHKLSQVGRIKPRQSSSVPVILSGAKEWCQWNHLWDSAQFSLTQIRKLMQFLKQILFFRTVYLFSHSLPLCFPILI